MSVSEGPSVASALSCVSVLEGASAVSVLSSVSASMDSSFSKTVFSSVISLYGSSANAFVTVGSVTFNPSDLMVYVTVLYSESTV